MMRILVTFVMVLAFCFGITAQGNAQKLEDFSGMAGCWEQKNDAEPAHIGNVDVGGGEFNARNGANR